MPVICPSATPPLAVASWTAIGGFLPCAVLGLIGALAATAVDMTDPQISFAGILPHWFYLVFLCIIVLGSITNNVLTAYSSGLSLQAMGIKARRSVTVLFDGIVGPLRDRVRPVRHEFSRRAQQHPRPVGGSGRAQSRRLRHRHRPAQESL